MSLIDSVQHNRLNRPMGRTVADKLSGIVGLAREHGVGRAVKFVAYRLHEEYSERRLGIRTTGLVTESELGHGSPEFLSYSGAPYRALWHCLGLVPIRRDQDVFLDIGSGMGRALITAATRPFRKVIGIEIAEAMAGRARQNIAAAQRHLKAPVQLEVVDARTYAIPDEVTVIHLFNPFVGTTLEQVGRNILGSLRRRPRPLHIIYGNQGHFEKLFMHEGWLTRKFTGRFQPGIGYAVYECQLAPALPG